jgi:hypothetical protein
MPIKRRQVKSVYSHVPGIRAVYYPPNNEALGVVYNPPEDLGVVYNPPDINIQFYAKQSGKALASALGHKPAGSRPHSSVRLGATGQNIQEGNLPIPEGNLVPWI